MALCSADAGLRPTAPTLVWRWSRRGLCWWDSILAAGAGRKASSGVYGGTYVCTYVCTSRHRLLYPAWVREWTSGLPWRIGSQPRRFRKEQPRDQPGSDASCRVGHGESCARARHLQKPTEAAEVDTATRFEEDEEACLEAEAQQEGVVLHAAGTVI